MEALGDVPDFAHARNRGYMQPVSAGKRNAAKLAKSTEWLVYRLGGPKATLLGTVTAHNRETAQAVAYEKFGIASRRERLKIVVQRASRA